MRPHAIALAVVGAFALTALTGAPANADRHDPDTDDCGTVYQVSYPSGKVRFSWTTRCDYGVARIEHGMTLTRTGGGNKTVTKSAHCIDRSARMRSCTKSIEIGNPPGWQTFTSHDEFAVYVFNPFRADITGERSAQVTRK